MPRYTVQQRYFARRDGKTFGPWSPDDENPVVELPDADAEWVNRDAPGTLKPLRSGGAKAASAPPADRQHRGGSNRGGKS